MNALDVVKGNTSFADYVIDMLAEGNGSVVSFAHGGQKKKGIVIGSKGDHLVVARSNKRHLVKSGKSQRVIESDEAIDDPLEDLPDEQLSYSQLDAIAEAMADGEVDLSSKPLFELTGRQLRFLFATGAFKAGKAAARAVARTSAGGQKIALGAKGLSNFSGSKEGPQVVRPAARAAAKQAMQRQLKAYKMLKTSAMSRARMTAPRALLSPSKGVPQFSEKNYLRAARADARGMARAI